jgi:phosphomannomutase
VVAAGFAATLKAEGRTPLDVLDELAVRHGVYLTDQVSLRVTDLRVRSTVMTGLRENPPTKLAGSDVSFEDLLPDADVLRFRGAGLRVLIRPSGTEPKLKAYVEVIEPVAGANSLEHARKTAKERLSGVIGEIEGVLAPGK